ncbi:WxL domain-containing protein [Lactiplantibacillus sp. WILCCON 0030]|uniref:WxL domain-containing protein n=1 Tax=Lactiplantibacillus brownii TaxID=3069269 RepID=A0ABU1A5T6_9LACO|nr:WxL domain-containing protein [Lactiplantibacillus brownii]MDQ7936325.1 WxL domain-containing protein [Lactiplantibacillus brownii]
MKRLITRLVLVSLAILVAPTTVKAADTTSPDQPLATGKTTAKIQFDASDTTSLKPMNPNNPNTAVTDPVLGQGTVTNVKSGASFVYVTENMTFGKTANLIDMFQAQKYPAEVTLNESKLTKAVSDDWKTNFIVEVADGRGANANWQLRVSGSPLSTGNTSVDGAKIEWPSAVIHRSGEAPEQALQAGNATTIQLDQSSNTILSFTGKEAAGVTTAQFAPKDIMLDVPANRAQPGTYSTDLNWTLADTPA